MSCRSQYSDAKTNIVYVNFVSRMSLWTVLCQDSIMTVWCSRTH